MAWLYSFWDLNPLLSFCLSSFLSNILSRCSSCSVLIVPAICPALCCPQLINRWKENGRNGNIKETKESTVDWKWQRRKKGKLPPTLAPLHPHLSPPPNCLIPSNLPSDFHCHPVVAIVCFLLLSPVGMSLRCLFPLVWTIDSPLFGPFIIIIIVHFILAAYRLWHSTVQDLGIPPIFSFSLQGFSASILVRSSSFCFLFCPLSTGTMLYQF